MPALRRDLKGLREGTFCIVCVSGMLATVLCLEPQDGRQRLPWGALPRASPSPPCRHHNVPLCGGAGAGAGSRIRMFGSSHLREPPSLNQPLATTCGRPEKRKGQPGPLRSPWILPGRLCLMSRHHDPEVLLVTASKRPGPGQRAPFSSRDLDQRSPVRLSASVDMFSACAMWLM